MGEGVEAWADGVVCGMAAVARIVVVVAVGGSGRAASSVRDGAHQRERDSLRGWLWRGGLRLARQGRAGSDFCQVPWSGAGGVLARARKSHWRANGGEGMSCEFARCQSWYRIEGESLTQRRRNGEENGLAAYEGAPSRSSSLRSAQRHSG